jgi:hypothetical protein
VISANGHRSSLHIPAERVNSDHVSDRFAPFYTKVIAADVRRRMAEGCASSRIAAEISRGRDSWMMREQNWR